MPSPELQLPPRDAEVLAHLAKLPISDTKELFSALQGIKPGIYLRAQLATAVQPFSDKFGLDPEDVARLTRAINQTRLRIDEDSEADFVKSLMDAVTVAAGDKVDAANLQSLIVNFIALDNIRESIKATLLAFESERHVHDIKIISDLRPVFTQSRDEITSLIITHTLKIEFADHSEQAQTIFFALDDDDLAQLEKVIVDARKKKRTLTAFIQKSNIRALEYQE